MVDQDSRFGPFDQAFGQLRRPDEYPGVLAKARSGAGNKEVGQIGENQKGPSPTISCHTASLPYCASTLHVCDLLRFIQLILACWGVFAFLITWSPYFRTRESDMGKFSSADNLRCALLDDEGFDEALSAKEQADKGG